MKSVDKYSNESRHWDASVTVYAYSALGADTLKYLANLTRSNFRVGFDRGTVVREECSAPYRVGSWALPSRAFEKNACHLPNPFAAIWMRPGTGSVFSFFLTVSRIKHKNPTLKHSPSPRGHLLPFGWADGWDILSLFSRLARSWASVGHSIDERQRQSGPKYKTIHKQHQGTSPKKGEKRGRSTHEKAK